MQAETFSGCAIFQRVYLARGKQYIALEVHFTDCHIRRDIVFQCRDPDTNLDHV